MLYKSSNWERKILFLTFWKIIESSLFRAVWNSMWLQPKISPPRSNARQMLMFAWRGLVGSMKIHKILKIQLSNQPSFSNIKIIWIFANHARHVNSNLYRAHLAMQFIEIVGFQPINNSDNIILHNIILYKIILHNIILYNIILYNWFAGFD